jgi:hypothetical protein
MSTPQKEALKGLACPRCGGMVPIPEGQAIVVCPFCDLRSWVRGERGLRRYQVPARVDREQAIQALRGFLSSSLAIGQGVAREARLNEAFVAYLPFWTVWSRVMGWVFGQEQVGSGDNKRYEPREIKIAQEMSWNGAACDVGEFGVDQVSLVERPLEPFDTQALHDRGMVFEPVSSLSEAQSAARQDFESRLRSLGKLDRVSQVILHTSRERSGLVYYPLWVLRYLYRGRAFQVVVDGFSGQVLYGKAPGSTLFRAGVLVGGMALGAFLAVDISALIAYFALQLEDGDAVLGVGALALAALAGGFGLMAVAYQRFRYGEHYEFHGFRKRSRRITRRAEKGVIQARENES